MNRTYLAANLKVGDKFAYRDTIVTVLREQEPHTDRFGQELFKYYSQREDTGAKGYMFFGPHGVVDLVGDL